MRLSLLDIHAIGPRVILVRTDEGWRLSDGHRFTTPYPDAIAPFRDRDTIRRLDFGEPLLNQEGGEPPKEAA